MTFAELKSKSEPELDAIFSSMPEPSFQKPINTEVDSLDKIIGDFDNYQMSKEDREALEEDLVQLV